MSLTLERILVVEYLVARGFLLRDLATMPKERANALFAEACQFAFRKLGDVEPMVVFSTYVPVGFSRN